MGNAGVRVGFDQFYFGNGEYARSGRLLSYWEFNELALSLQHTINAPYKNTNLVVPRSAETSAGTLLITSANNGQTFQHLKIISRTVLTEDSIRISGFAACTP